MTERNDGGPAFPNVNEMGYGDLGMSLRDYFAAKAMQGILSGDNENLFKIWSKEDIDKDDEANEDFYAGENFLKNLLSEIAYKIADAMLEARE